MSTAISGTRMLISMGSSTMFERHEERRVKAWGQREREREESGEKKSGNE
jgi:hypothetical protein